MWAVLLFSTITLHFSRPLCREQSAGEGILDYRGMYFWTLWQLLPPGGVAGLVMPQPVSIRSLGFTPSDWNDEAQIHHRPTTSEPDPSPHWLRIRHIAAEKRRPAHDSGLPGVGAGRRVPQPTWVILSCFGVRQVIRYRKGTLMDLKQRAKQLKTDIPAVFLALKHKDTPFIAKAIAAVTVCYALSPIDLIPDFIPVLGYLDDVMLLPSLIGLTVKLIPRDVFEQCRRESEGLWANGRPKKWYFAIPIVLFWLLILWMILKVILF